MSGPPRDDAVSEHPVESRLTRLYADDLSTRRRRVEQACGLQAGALDALDDGFPLDAASRLVENVVGLLSLPLGIATNFVIDGHQRLIPMAIEEPSVVAAASNAARMAREGGGFSTSATDPITIAQVEIREVTDIRNAVEALEAARPEIAERSLQLQQTLVKRGGGFRDMVVRVLPDETTVVVHLMVDCRDAMGANAVNTLAETLAPRLAALAGGRVGLRILSNLADRRLARASCRIPPAALTRADSAGVAVRDGVVAATRFAMLDPYRATTHNKGVMNGVDAVIMATCNDWRAVEAGAHAYAARTGQYGPLTQWTVGDDGALVGQIEIPLAVGIVGGATRVHPVAQLARRILRLESATDLARVAAAVGLAQNLAALAALASEGIQRGHMALHARSRHLDHPDEQ